MRVLVVAVLACPSSALFAALPAGATAPGENGRIAFRRFVGPDLIATIFTIRPDGTGERQLAQPPEGAGDDFPDYASDGSLIAFDRCGDLAARSWSRGPTAAGSHPPAGCRRARTAPNA